MVICAATTGPAKLSLSATVERLVQLKGDLAHLPLHHNLLVVFLLSIQTLVEECPIDLHVGALFARTGVL